MTLTKEEARELEARNFKLVHVSMHLDGTDTYEVYAEGDNSND